MQGVVGPYSLVIAEKPDAAFRISRALDQTSKIFRLFGASYWVAGRGGSTYVVCSALGHLYGLAAKRGTSGVYPVLDLFWSRLPRGASTQIKLISELSKSASHFILACDYDVEGDAIGFNVLKYACKADLDGVSRVKFSTLTSEDILAGFGSPIQEDGWLMATAGRTRHVLDFVWGVNVSRALALAVKGSGNGYINLSLGRVQGPTLHYVYARDVERNLHVPTPSWRIQARCSVNNYPVTLEYSEIVRSETEANLIRVETEGKHGSVRKLELSKVGLRPPAAFNIGDLQHEAYRLFGYSPSMTLRIAESLYLKALISYPRTNSQQLPESIQYSKVLGGLSAMEDYGRFVPSLLNRKPTQGIASDSAHPAIFPTGLQPVNLDRNQRVVYDLVARRFMAAFSKPAIRETAEVEVSNGDRLFRTSGSRIAYSGWLSIYHFPASRESWIPEKLSVGDKVHFDRTDALESFTRQPPEYNLGSLLRRMEDDRIGTKATRADVIDALYKRGYVEGKTIQVTELGVAVIESVLAYYPSMASVEMTRDLEGSLERLEGRSSDFVDVIKFGASRMVEALEEFRLHDQSIAEAVVSGHRATARRKNALGGCPVCRDGELIMITSRKSGKRFVGCSNFARGCRASAPLPQRGIVRKTDHPCKTCGWPIVLVYFRGRRYPWRICINMACPNKRDGKVKTPVSKRIEG